MLPSKHLILCHLLLLLPSIFPNISVFSNELALCIRWPKYWSFNFKLVLPMNIQEGFPLGLTGLISLQSKGLSRVSSSTTFQNHTMENTLTVFQLICTVLQGKCKDNLLHTWKKYFFHIARLLLIYQIIFCFCFKFCIYLTCFEIKGYMYLEISFFKISGHCKSKLDKPSSLNNK